MVSALLVAAEAEADPIAATLVVAAEVATTAVAEEAATMAAAEVMDATKSS